MAHEKLSVRRQCELLGVARSGLYYTPAGVSGEDLVVSRIFRTFSVGSWVEWFG